MKNFLLGVFAVLLGIVLGIGGLYLAGDIQLSSVGDTQVIENDTVRRTCMGNLLTAQFSSASEVASIQDELSWEVSCTNVFREIPRPAVENVTNMLLRTRQHVTIYDIVKEYLQNKQIYDNIVPDAVIDQNTGGENPDPVTTTTTESTNTSSANTSTPTTATTDNIAPADPDPVAGKSENVSSDSTTVASK